MPYDNESEAFVGSTTIVRCPACRQMLNKWEASFGNFRVAKRGMDISCTYDFQVVVSKRFRDVYDAHGMGGLVFRDLPGDAEFWGIMAEQTVQFDAQRAGTKFLDRCEQCGRYEAVIGTKPCSLLPGEHVPPNGFVRTDLEFAAGDNKGPLLICGLEAGGTLKESKLKGVLLFPVEAPELRE